MHSNASNLEAYFSMVCLYKGEKTIKCTGIEGIIDTRHQLMALENIQICTSDFIQQDSPIKSIENVLNRKDSWKNSQTMVIWKK